MAKQDGRAGVGAQPILVLDTSVLVHDPMCFRTFTNVEVVIPIFVVMELDELKTSRRLEVAAAARSVSRFISALMERGSLHSPSGVRDEATGARYRIVAGDGGGGVSALKESVGVRKMDLLILGTALKVKHEAGERPVKLLSKDVNLRILADFEGIPAEDYNKDRVQPMHMYPGYRVVGEFDAARVQTAYAPEGELRAAEIGLEGLCPHEYVIFRADERELLLRYRAEDGTLRPVPKDFARSAGVTPRNVEQRMAMDLLMDPGVQLVSLVGKAGTGKTFLALAAAMAQVRFASVTGYDRVLLSKPVIPMGKDIGYLPGDFQEKMQPWMMSFFDNLDQLIPVGEEAMAKGASHPVRPWEHLFETGQLEVQAIHSIRGRSISNAFMLIDEAQNLTPHEIKTIITRAAEGTKVVISGDPFQVDNAFLDSASNGLVYATERVKDSPMTGAVMFTKGERSPLAELAATLL